MRDLSHVHRESLRRTPQESLAEARRRCHEQEGRPTEACPGLWLEDAREEGGGR